MFKYFAALVLALSAVCSYAEYTSEDDVIELTTENFKELVLGNDEPWMVEFYAPWCGHCKKLEPEWKKAATALKDTVKLGAVDMTKHREAGKEYGIKGFPTIKLFADDKQNPTKYQGQRTAEAIGKAAADAVKKVEASRLKKQEDVPVKATETEEVRREL